MKYIKTSLIALTLIALAAITNPLAAVYASPADQINQGVAQVGGGSPSSNGLTKTITTIVDVLLFLVGIVAVVMIIIGGIRYVVSGGDSKATGDAKNTILYAVIGLVVAIMAYAIVHFITSRFK